MKPTISLSPYSPDHSEAFYKLNVEWISKYFDIEPKDLEQLRDPDEIIQSGGQVFFAFDDEEPIGTCALLNKGDGVFELAKMAVTETHQSLGIGSQLLEYAESWALSNKVQKLFLLSNTSLKPALHLYKKHNFVETYRGPHPEYKRSNIKFEKELYSTQPTLQ